MPDYRYVLADASTGVPICELPLSDVTFTRVLTGCGQLSATVPLWHPTSTEANYIADREVSVFRDDVPVWNGPLVHLDASRSSDAISLLFREPTWYFSKRVLEEDKTYTLQDKANIVRDLFAYMTMKTASGSDGMTAGADIVASLPRFNVDAIDTGFTTAATFSGAARHTIQEILDWLTVDPETGFDYRMDYETGSTRQEVHRSLLFASPDAGFGVQHFDLLTEHVLSDYSRGLDWDIAATRTHAVGAGYTKTLQNSGSVAAGTLLLEFVADAVDAPDHGTVDSLAKEHRRLRHPPVRIFTFEHTPTSALPFGWCDLNDRVTLNIAEPSMLSIHSTVRIVEVAVTPPTGDGDELVSYVANFPLDDLGA